MSTDIKLCKAQISKKNQLGGFLCGMLGSLGILGKKAVTDPAIPLAKDNLPWLVSNIASNVISKAIDKPEEK